MRTWMWMPLLAVGVMPVSDCDCDGSYRPTETGSVSGHCIKNSFWRNVGYPAHRDPFTMMFVGDPQFYWWRGGKDPDCKDDCVRRMGVNSNQDTVNAMNRVTEARSGDSVGVWPAGKGDVAGRGTQIQRPRGVVVNGDLTSFFKEEQAHEFWDMYHDNPNDPKTLDYVLYPGLGNHDYENNVGKCAWAGGGRLITRGDNGCASMAVDYIKDVVCEDRDAGHSIQGIVAFHEPSRAYSWNEGGYHFVQLHNHPDYEVPEIGIKHSLEWLRTDLEWANAWGFKSVVNLHDFPAAMRADDDAFVNAIRDVGVVAVLSAHFHPQVGYMGTIADTEIPRFQTGAPEYYRFLLASFDDDGFTMAVMDAADGQSSFVDPSNSKMYHRFDY